MTPLDIPGFLLGRRKAILAASRPSVALPVGAFLVFTAGIAREYDHTLFPGTAFFRPFLVSLISACWIYGVLWWSLLPRDAANPKSAAVRFGFLKFLGLFWMTAPLAWFYAIPFEQWMDPAAAMKANLWMLALVAVWRVGLLSRAVSVAGQAPMISSCFVVAIAASVEVAAISWAGAFFTGMLRAMAGLRMSPENLLLESVAKTAARVSGVVALLGSVALFVLSRFKPTLPAAADNKPSRSGILVWVCFALCITGLWYAIARRPQELVANHRQLTVLLLQGKCRAAADFAASLTPEDFPVTHRFPPTPFSEDGSFTKIVSAVMALESSHPGWLQKAWLENLGASLYHPVVPTIVMHRLSEEGELDVLGLARHIANLPEGKQWAREHQARLRSLEQYSPEFPEALEILGIAVPKPQ